MPDKKYSRVEEEILQILDRMDDESPPSGRPNLRLVHSRPIHKRRFTFRKPQLALPSAGVTLALVVAVAFAARMTSGTLQLIATLLTVAALVMLFIPRKRSTTMWTGSAGTKRWRGRDISFSPDTGDSPADRARRWIDHRRGNR
jgi:hypothetical protein